MSGRKARNVGGLLAIGVVWWASGALAVWQGPGVEEEVLVQPQVVADALRAGAFVFEVLRKPDADQGENARPAPDFRVRFREPRTLVTLQGESLVLSTRFARTKSTRERMNLWNREKRFSRAFLDEEGEPTLVAVHPIPLASRSALLQLCKVYRESLDDFATFLGSKNERPGSKSRRDAGS